jgi:hypothetical protein
MREQIANSSDVVKVVTSFLAIDFQEKANIGLYSKAPKRAGRLE